MGRKGLSFDKWPQKFPDLRTLLFSSNFHMLSSRWVRELAWCPEMGKDLRWDATFRDKIMQMSAHRHRAEQFVSGSKEKQLPKNFQDKSMKELDCN